MLVLRLVKNMGNKLVKAFHRVYLLLLSLPKKFCVTLVS